MRVHKLQESEMATGRDLDVRFGSEAAKGSNVSEWLSLLMETKRTQDTEETLCISL